MEVWKIEVKHEESGKVIRIFEYSSENSRDKGYRGLLEVMNMGEYTAYLVDHNEDE